MRKPLLALLLFIGNFSLFSQSLDNLSFGEENTFEVATWNLEFFPKNGQTTIDSAAMVIKSLDIDVFALQEINDVAAFQSLLNNLPGWDGFFASNTSPGLAYVYDTSEIEVIIIYQIYQSFQREFPRPPLVMELLFKGEHFVIINNHFKCCGNGVINHNDPWDEEKRRFDASNLLTQLIGVNYSNNRVIVLGDLNDVLTDNAVNNVFQDLLDDPTNYLFADMGIAQGSSSQWSFPSWPSHLDHIFMTSELFPEFGNDSSEIKTIRVSDFLAGGLSEYDATMTDHYPVALKIQINPNSVGIDASRTKKRLLSVYPNPTAGSTRIRVHSSDQAASIKIFTLTGQLIDQLYITRGQSSITWESGVLPEGIYYFQLLHHEEIKAVEKVVIFR